MASSDESVRFVGESHPGEDPFEATSRMTGSQSVGPSGGRRQSLRQMAATFCRLIDEEEEEVGGNEGEASSPREGEENGHGPCSCTMDWGSLTLMTSQITQMRRDFFIPSSQVIYTPGPEGRAPFPLANCLSFFITQVRAGLRFPIPFFIAKWLTYSRFL
ncbi:UNVERIFIED_CONTAM: hypothetical protein Slati_3092200 [Sesamum latifolium]|uniref:Uncharacterized protein n=1 Tax=Sesamum latifolium TaxID=2727402 RepID=A0AAW2UVQ6_9LAMI